jgi:hypothetical protein
MQDFPRSNRPQDKPQSGIGTERDANAQSALMTDATSRRGIRETGPRFDHDRFNDAVKFYAVAVTKSLIRRQGCEISLY